MSDRAAWLLRVLPVALLWSALAAAPATQAADSHVLLGAAAPDFAAKAVSGQNVRLSEYRGDVVLVSFWSGRCNVCRGQLAALERISQTYRSAGLMVVSLNLDANEDRALDFAASLDVTYPVVTQASKDIGRAYQVDALPTVVMIDRRGKVRFVRQDWRQVDEADYVRALRPLLDE